MGKLKELQTAVERFLYDIQFVPPWESAGAAWADKVKRLQMAWLDSMGLDLETYRQSKEAQARGERIPLPDGADEQFE